jgi:PAS domain S-box-containing protein
MVNIALKRGLPMKFFSGSAQHHRDNMVWQAAFERSCDAILVLSGAKIIACNEAAVRFGGYRAKADLLSRSPADIAPELQPDGRSSTDVGKDKVALAMTEGHARFEWITRRADGAHMPVQVTLVPDRADGRPVVLSYRCEVSDLVAAREEKKRLVAKLAGEFEQMIGSIATLSASKVVETTAASATRTAEQSTRRVSCRRLRPGLHQCAVGGRRDRGTVELGCRDQINRHVSTILGDHRRSRPGGGAHQRSGQQPRGGGGQDRRRHRHDQRDREPG